MRTFALMAGAAAAMAAEFIASEPVISPRFDPAYRRPHRRKTGKLYRANGKRECARRRAQIAAGKLTAANGVVPC